MKNNGEVIFLLFVIIILLVIIGYLISCKTITTETFTEVANESTQVEKTEDNAKEDDSSTRTLNENELDLFEQYLESEGVWNFLYVQYADVSEFNLKEFLTYYFVNSTDATDKQILEYLGEKEPNVPMHLYFKTNLDETFKKFTGKDVSVITNKDYLPPVTKDGYYYYNRTSDANFADFDVISGTEDGNKYVITYTAKSFDGEKYEVTLEKVDGKFLFVSNVKAE